MYGDNRGVVEGWWKGRSRNRPTNTIFKRIHELSASSHCSILTRYVPSAHNPADGPSRGIYPPESLLLPPIPIPPPLQNFIANFNDPSITPGGYVHTARLRTRSATRTNPLSSDHTKKLNDELRRQGEELLKAAQA